MRFLADDCLPVDLRDEHAYAEPSGESHWLDAESCCALRLHASSPRIAKTCFSPVSRQAGPARLAAAVKLLFDDAVRSPELDRGSGRGSFLVLGAAMFRFALFDGEVLARDLDQLSRFIRCVPLYTLRRPRRFDALDESVQLLTRLFEVES